MSKLIYRTNNEGGTATINVAVARREDVTIFVPPAPDTLSHIMVGYPKSYWRASNCNYFGNPAVGNLLGIAYVDGTKNEGGEPETRDWDAVSYRQNGVFVEVSPVKGGDAEPNLRLSESIWALQVGPLLLAGQGWRTDIAKQIDKGYTGLNEYQSTRNQEPILRVAIGYSPGRDLVVHYFVESGGMSLPDMQALGESHELSWMLMLDGGGSAGLIDKSRGTGVIGYNTRMLPSTFIFRAEQPVPTSWI